MKKISKARGSQQSQATKRQIALGVLQDKAANYSTVKIAKILKVHRVTVSGWKKELLTKNKKFINNANKAVVGKRGRKIGFGKVLTNLEERKIKTILIDKNPDQLKLPFYLWSISALILYIKSTFKKNIPDSTMRLYLKRWGFTIQRPKTRTFARNDVVIQNWLKNDYQIIKIDAKKEQGQIYWLDETGVNNQAFYQRGYALKGQTPIIRKSASNFKINVISTVNNQGKMRFMTYKNNLNPEIFIKFLLALIKDSKDKIFLIADNLSTHKSVKVKQFLNQENIKNKIVIYYLPPYAPEINPDEYLNNDLKQNVHKAGLPKNPDQLETNTRRYLRSIQKQPEKVRSYFKTKWTEYAAEEE